MPASEIMQDFNEGNLHSGKSGKIVTNKKQAKAIQLSYLRKEGKISSKPPAPSKAAAMPKGPRKQV